jgi:hypothetical protein
MTTFTTEDRIIAEQNGSVTINVEPIPFAGLVTITESAPRYKDLTDEEIIETVKDHFIGAIKVGIVLTNDNVLGFARAILRKAQEK